MCNPFNRSPATSVLVLSIAITAVQLLSSGLVSVAISPNTMTEPFALAEVRQIGDLRHWIRVGNFVHQTPLAKLVVLQAVCLAPGVAALANVKWLAWFPVYATPGIISNGVEGLLYGQVRNWFVVPFGNDSRHALSVGDMWVYVALALWLIHVVRVAFRDMRTRI